MGPSSTTDIDINTPYALSQAQIDAFARDGFVKLKGVLSSDILKHYGATITRRVKELNDLDEVAWDQRDTYQKAFIQVMNIWTKDEQVKEFVFSRRLAQIASELLNTDGVRLYHDQALYKEPAGNDDGGHTPWHADQYYWPLDTAKTVTAWIPLQAVPLEMGPLTFAARSQEFEFGRDMSISDESETSLQEALNTQGFAEVIEPFDLGEVSFHTGWTFHRAGPNRSQRPREVMTVIYMDQNARVHEPANDNQKADHETWLPGVKVGDVAASAINPVLYQRP